MRNSPNDDACTAHAACLITRLLCCHGSWSSDHESTSQEPAVRKCHTDDDQVQQAADTMPLAELLVQHCNLCLVILILLLLVLQVIPAHTVPHNNTCPHLLQACAENVAPGAVCPVAYPGREDQTWDIQQARKGLEVTIYCSHTECY